LAVRVFFSLAQTRARLTRGSDTRHAPHVFLDGCKSDAMYTLLMVDPDAVRPEWRHWLICNIPGSKLDHGSVVTEYYGPNPPLGTGPHRYVFLLCEQADGKVDVERMVETHAAGRMHGGGFHTRKFMDQFKMTPVGATFVTVKHGNAQPHGSHMNPSKQ
jgi:phosphatidylethanolamine-binding protein (PEBP) family uncharacterized protein